jgi:hypothetical protein
VKRFLFLGVVLAVGMAWAATVISVRGKAGDGSGVIVFDTANGTAKVRTDTLISDVVDLSSVGATSRVITSVNLGAVVKCDSCNDSILIYTLTQIKSPNSSYWKQIDSTAVLVGSGANNVTTVDEKVVTHILAADSIQGTQMRFWTITKDSVIETAAHMVTYPAKSVIPLSMEVTIKP